MLRGVRSPGITAGPSYLRLRLKDAGPRRLPVLALIRRSTGLSPRQVKELADTPDAVLVTGWRSDVLELAREFHLLGAFVEMEPFDVAEAEDG